MDLEKFERSARAVYPRSIVYSFDDCMRVFKYYFSDQQKEAAKAKKEARQKRAEAKQKQKRKLLKVIPANDDRQTDLFSQM